MWTWDKWLVFSVPFLLIGLGVLGAVLFRGTFRTRLRVARQLRDDPDINEWLVVFNWSRKVLYFPTIIVSVVFGILALIFPQWEAALGGIWLGVFFLNFLVDEYEISAKVLLIGVMCLVALVLWLGFLGWVGGFLAFFANVAVRIDPRAYFLIAGIFAVAIGVAWLRGLFYYVAITPNYLNIQTGPSETGEQLNREEYSTRVDTGDFLERLFGFGRIVITFADHRRQPMMLLVGRIGTVAERLESIRGKMAFDLHQPAREGKIDVGGV